MSCCGHVLHVELLVPGGNYKERFQDPHLTITERTYVSKEAIFIKISMYPLKNV